MIARLREELVLFLLALQFLTRLPLPAELGWSPERFAATPRWYPAVGALLGAIRGLVWLAAAALFPPVIAALLTVAAGLLATGAFHQDGLADTIDGLGGGSSRERVLAIMRDSRIGTYGAAALGLALALEVACLASLPTTLVPPALVAAEAASRAALVGVVADSTYVREEGVGKPVAGGVSSTGLLIASACGLLATLPFAGLAGWGAWGAGLLGLLLGRALVRRAFEKRLGGYTGDCLGAVQQAAFLGFLLGAVAGSRTWGG